jgi:hypothetical protein
MFLSSGFKMPVNVTSTDRSEFIETLILSVAFESPTEKLVSAGSVSCPALLSTSQDARVYVRRRSRELNHLRSDELSQ